MNYNAICMGLPRIGVRQEENVANNHSEREPATRGGPSLMGLPS